MDIWSYDHLKEKPLNLYEITSVDKIWDDTNAKGYLDTSFWKPVPPSDKYLVVSHLAMDKRRKPNKALVIKETKSADGLALQRPTDYHEVWNDDGKKIQL